MLFNCSIILLNIILYFLIGSSQNLSKDKKNIIYLRITFFIIALLMATRTYGTGTDTIMYANTFERFATFKWNSTIFGGYYEPLYVVLNILLSYISKNPRILIVISSVFISFSFYKFIKNNSKNYFLSVMMFICLLFFYGAMNTIRQYIAMSIILLGFEFVKERNFLKYLVTVILAYLFHSSALIGILIYPLYNIKYSHLRVVMIFMIAILVNISVSDVVNSIYNIIGRTNYYDYRVGQENIANMIYMIVYFAMYVFALFEVKRNKFKNKNSGFYLYIFVMASSFSLIAMNLNVLARVTTYFSIFSLICLPNIITENIAKKDNRLLVNIIILIILITYSNVIIKYRPEWNTAYNYKNCIISDDEDYIKLKINYMSM